MSRFIAWLSSTEEVSWEGTFVTTLLGFIVGALAISFLDAVYGMFFIFAVTAGWFVFSARCINRRRFSAEREDRVWEVMVLAFLMGISGGAIILQAVKLALVFAGWI